MRIKDFGQVVTGKTPSTNDPNNFIGNIPFATPADIAKGFIIHDTERHISEKGFNSIINQTFGGPSVMVGCIGSDMGNAAISLKKFASNQQINTITNFKNIANPFFVYYFLSTKKEYLQGLAGSTATPLLPKSDFENIDIPLPDRAEQDKITDCLMAIDYSIQNNNNICADLEAMAKLLYEYWIVQFDFPDENGKPYKSSGGRMVWNEQLKREIPEGWIVSPLSNYLNCNQNTITQNNLGEYITYLDTGSLTENVIDQIQTINRSEGLPSRARRVVKENDILYSTVRPIQKHYGIIKHPVENMIASTGFAVLSAKQGSSYNELFYLFITSEDNLRILDAIANNSVSSYPSINPDDILNLRIALPPDLTSLRELCRKLQNCYEMIDAEQKENKVLEQLRDFLLPMLMNGQVKV